MSAPDDLIDRDVFIATYVDLRVAALATETGTVDDDKRTEVLARHDVSESQLLDFGDYHAEDLDFMREVWNEIEELLDARRSTIDDVRS